MLGKLIKGLFGSSAGGPARSAAAAPVLYDGYEIIADPMASNGQWQVAGRIEKDVEGERKVHTFIRADTMPTSEEAAEHMVRKAKVMIDQQGAGIFS
ncbi:HlyU family transcriptional regulator [Roseibium sp.]|uniref:HlyU family transcriptional regulator n=1 Tax=Roseibium sp. TaxID=1936156 RepID=UPI003A96C01B